jgi:fused signal recognition particle receptor
MMPNNIIQQEKNGLIHKLRTALSKTQNRLTEEADKLQVTDEYFFDNLEEILIGADVGFPATRHILQNLEKKMGRKDLKSQLRTKQLLRNEANEILSRHRSVIDIKRHKPFVILMVGVNGTGKTTTIGKLAHRYRKGNLKVMLAAADTFRAAAIEQLEIWSARAGTDFIKHAVNSDPAAVAYDAVNAAKNRNMDVLIIDTAGRLHTKINLMEELKKIRKIIDREIPGAPHETLIVLDANTGQNAVSQAKQFHEAVGLTGIVMTKLDSTAKGGGLLGIVHEMDMPVKLIGVGEGVEDLEIFDFAAFVNALFE